MVSSSMRENSKSASHSPGRIREVCVTGNYRMLVIRGCHFLLVLSDNFLAWSITIAADVSLENEQNSLYMLGSRWKSDALCLCVMEILIFGEILSMGLFPSGKPTS